MFQFSLLKCLPQQIKFAKNPRYIRAEKSAGSKGAAARGKEGVPYHIRACLQSSLLTL